MKSLHVRIVAKNTKPVVACEISTHGREFLIAFNDGRVGSKKFPAGTNMVSEVMKLVEAFSKATQHGVSVTNLRRKPKAA